jgi:hypothetical protein
MDPECLPFYFREPSQLFFFSADLPGLTWTGPDLHLFGIPGLVPTDTRPLTGSPDTS